MNSQRAAPLVSVIVPAYNYGRYLGATLGSLLAQTYSNWECIVVDDGSTDDSVQQVQAIARNDARVRLVAGDHGGAARARNSGIAAASGDYLQFLDADDLLESRKLEYGVQVLQTQAAVDIVYGEVRYFRDERENERTLSWDGGSHDWTKRLRGSGEPVQEALLLANITAIHAPLSRRAIIESAGGFDETLRDAEDWDLWLACALHGATFYYAAAPGTRALVRSHGDSSSRNRSAMITAEIAIRQKIDGQLPAALASLNSSRLAAAHYALQLEAALAQPTPGRCLRKLARAALAQRRPAALWHALALLAARRTPLRTVRLLVGRWRAALRRSK